MDSGAPLGYRDTLPVKGHLVLAGVITSFRDFQSYERELADLRAQLERLQRIRHLSKALADDERDRDVATYLASEYAWKHAANELTTTETRLKKLREDHAEDEARFTERVALIEESNARRDHLNSLLNESSEGRLYKKLSNDIGKLEDEIERLRSLANKIDGGMGKRIKAARAWMEQVASKSGDKGLFEQENISVAEVWAALAPFTSHRPSGGRI